MSSREFDVVLFGATGFVGGIIARYLAESAPPETKIALAGRSETKLKALRTSLPDTAAQWELIVADADTPSQLDQLCARTQVVATTVGPYLKYGESLVTAAATAGTDYIDLTGEVPFVRWSIDKLHETATASGARIVHSCGFDSVPSDIGVFVLSQFAKSQKADDDLANTTLVVRKVRGGVSGGTIDSMRVVVDQARNREQRRILLNPHALTHNPGESMSTQSAPNDMSVVSAKSVDPSLRGALSPFFMASHNTRIVRRSAAILNYGKRFNYRETMQLTKNPIASTVLAAITAVAVPAAFGALAVKPIRKLADKFLPKPGEGPSEKARNAGYFVTDVYATTESGARYRSTMKAKGDPGYQATAVMFAEAALSLALHHTELPRNFGVLTPAAAMGSVLVNRLRDAGFEITVEKL